MAFAVSSREQLCKVLTNELKCGEAKIGINKETAMADERVEEEKAAAGCFAFMPMSSLERRVMKLQPRPGERRQKKREK